MIGRNEITELLEKRGCKFSIAGHKAVFTIGEMLDAGVPHPERIAKNLFLRDDKKRAYYLVTLENSRTADLKALRTLLSSRPLSFASESDLEAILGLGKGEVTPFGLLNDKEHRTVFVLDSFFSEGIIGIHPNDNTATVFLKTSDLLSILSENGTECRTLQL